MRPSLQILILANLIPMLGVAFLDWSVFQVVVLYWTENIVIGLINLLKMARLDEAALTRDLPISTQAAKALNLAQYSGSLKLLFMPFFALHYGLFCWAHGRIVVAVLGQGAGYAEALSTPVLLATAVLFLSHLYSFRLNYLRRGERNRESLLSLMRKPYGRIVVMHLTILFGAFAMLAFDTPTAVLMLLIGLKIGLDVMLHTRERRNPDTHPRRILATTAQTL